jgi:hypothetical protein
MTPLALLAVTLLAAGDPAPEPPGAAPCARHYVLLFGGQSDSLRPRTAHTWAAYVRAEPQPDGTARLETVVISWLPVTLKVRPLALRDEPGRNLSLAETFAFMSGPRQRIALWGPYEIPPCAFAEAAARKAVLDSGSLRYRANNWFGTADDSVHCLRALAAAHAKVEPAWRVARGVGESGMAAYAADLVAARLARKPCDDADWLLPALGVPASVVRRSVP